jgi:hypothetical protein
MKTQYLLNSQFKPASMTEPKATAITSEEEHPISLKVMRLTKPVLNCSVPFGSERADLAFESVSASSTSQARISGTDSLGISPLLILPSSFGACWCDSMLIFLR